MLVRKEVRSSGNRAGMVLWSVPTLESQDFLKGWKQFTLELEKISRVFVAHLHLISIRSTYSIAADSKRRGESFWSTLKSSSTLIQGMHESNCLQASEFSLTLIRKLM